MSLKVSFVLNGKRVEAQVHPGSTLLDALKHELGIVSVKRGCETGECGACTVLLDGRPVTACLVLAAKAGGRTITTLEGLQSEEGLRALQRTFIDKNAAQCGVCTPGFLVTLFAFLKKHPDASREDIRRAVEGNLCRCGAYLEIEEAALGAKDAFTASRDTTPLRFARQQAGL